MENETTSPTGYGYGDAAMGPDTTVVNGLVKRWCHGIPGEG